ncbi:MAG: FEA1-related lipoprotein [Acidimicrobiales bacterium]
MMHTSRLRLASALVVSVLALAACSGDDGATVRDLGSEDSSASGSTSRSSSASASAPSGSDVGSDEEDGGYAYASNVSAHRMLVADLCPLGDLLDAGEFEAVAALYRDGGSSVNSDGSVRTIAGFATSEDRLHGLADYYSAATPLDDFVSAALDGTGMFESESQAVRAQAVEKGIRNQAMIAWLVHELESALDKARSGDFDVAEGAVHNWDEAWAFYHGAEPGCAPYATANSRAGNFGTVADDGATALANIDILDAMIAGRDALVAQDLAGAEAAAAEVRRGVFITYSQAAVRYASVIEADLAADDIAAAEEHQAEGLAFWRVIEAYAAQAGADVATVNAIFDLANPPGANGFGDDVRAALAPAWQQLGITEADIGTLQ